MKNKLITTIMAIVFIAGGITVASAKEIDENKVQQTSNLESIYTSNLDKILEARYTAGSKNFNGIKRGEVEFSSPMELGNGNARIGFVQSKASGDNKNIRMRYSLVDANTFREIPGTHTIYEHETSKTKYSSYHRLKPGSYRVRVENEGHATVNGNLHCYFTNVGN